ncbi:MAG: phasin family protein [Pseudomonadota bacterium]
MNNPVEQIIATNQENVDVITGWANQAFSGIEKLVELNLATSKEAIAEAFSHTQSLLGAKDPQELLALQSEFFTPLAEKSAAYAQQVQTIVTDSKAEITKALEAQTAGVQRIWSGVLQNLTQNAPTGSETAMAAFKSAFSAGQNVVEMAQAQTKKVVETAQSNFAAAATQVKKASRVA